MRTLRLLSIIFLAQVTLAGARPTLWIIGDSTVRNGSAGQMGWGDPLVSEFDPAKIEVINRAIGGRSSRTFLTEGRWDAILPLIQPGDFLLMQFGHNDGGDLFTGDRPRASLKGNGNDTKEGVVEVTGERETVHSFGWYLRKYASEAKAKGAAPIIVSLIPRNNWKDGKIVRGDKDYALWARQAAEETKSNFIDFNSILADKYEAMGPEKTGALFASPDHTHTNAAGAAFHAATLATAIRSLPNCKFGETLHPAGLWLPSIFSDHMVLQRGLPIQLWGRARPGAAVHMTFARKSITTNAAGDGAWKVQLPPAEAGGPFTMEISSSGAMLTYHDVLIGEVWLCSGQSNMDFTVAPTKKRYFAGTRDWQKEVANANHPAIRMFTAEWTMREFPQPDVAGSWQPCTPETAGDFSAVAYFFGREIRQELDVPVGLITCAYGASTAEAWMSRGKIAAHPQLKPLPDAWGKKQTAFRDDVVSQRKYANAMARWIAKPSARAPGNPDPVQDQHNPTVLFNGMIAPIIPYPIRGAIWYQGESNVGARKLYPALQQSLIEDWRARWGLGDFPFYFVQLASHNAPKAEPAESSLASMREAQAASLELANTGMIVTIDIGDEKDIHPRNKQDVGHRLARLALVGTYGKPGESQGPAVRESSIHDGAVRVRFDHCDGGLMAKNGALRCFEIAAANGRFVRADAVIDADSVLVSSPSIAAPVRVRYAWADNPAGANLYNSAGLPAAPFQTRPPRANANP